ARIQFLYEGDDFTGLFNYHVRDLDGSPIAFRANTIKPGTNDLVDGFENDVVYHDAASRATQQVESQGASLKLEWDLANHTVTSISGWESAEIYSRADIDGGYGGFSINDVPVAMGPGFIPFSSESADGIPDQDQYTQELRLSSNFAGDVNYQVGVFYFDEALTIENFSYDTANNGVLNGFVSQQQDTKAWAVFGSVDYTITDDLKVTAGLRYSDDE
ncbi:TonB-dependent receptor, partial [Pseudoalteromonas sp. S1609]